MYAYAYYAYLSMHMHTLFSKHMSAYMYMLAQEVPNRQVGHCLGSCGYECMYM